MLANGTTYHDSTDIEVVGLLEYLRKTTTRISVTYCDAKTGKPWDDRPDCGRVSRSMGPIKIPILLHNRRSLGGAGLLEHCILRIEYANKRKGGVLYQRSK